MLEVAAAAAAAAEQRQHRPNGGSHPALQGAADPDCLLYHLLVCLGLASGRHRRSLPCLSEACAGLPACSRVLSPPRCRRCCCYLVCLLPLLLLLLQEFKEANRNKEATGIELIPNESNVFLWTALIKAREALSRWPTTRAAGAVAAGAVAAGAVAAPAQLLAACSTRLTEPPRPLLHGLCSSSAVPCPAPIIA